MFAHPSLAIRASVQSGRVQYILVVTEKGSHA